MSREPQLVRVALPRSGDQLYTYRVPPQLEPLRPGVRVVVPLGTRRLGGLVVEPGSPDDVEPEQLRDVQLALDARPVVSEPLLQLARFVSDYYLCPLGDVVRAMLPGSPSTGLVASLTDAGRLAAAGAARGSRQHRILKALAEPGHLSEAGLRRSVGGGGLAAALRDLQRRGWIELAETLSGSGPRELQAWRATSLAAGAERERRAVGTSRLRGQLLELLRGHDGELTAAEIAAGLGRPESSVRQAVRHLVEAGLAEEHRRRVGRMPDALPGDREAARRDATRRLTADQAAALEEALALVDADRFDVLMLEGVTGSGKTEVYLRAFSEVVSRGRTGIYLVPEIAITPLLLRAVRARFGSRTALLHSHLSPGERHDERDRILRGEVDLVVGARSAVFAPMPRLGLLIVDEEHDASYKQDSAPRYHGRDVAVVRGRIEGVPVLLGSATPSLESYRNAVEGRYRLQRMPHRTGGARHAEVELVDMREEFRSGGGAGPFSRRLREALDATLAAGRQAMILLNRRGWADFLLCRQCGEPERCDHCAVTLTPHLGAGFLACHYCDMRRDIPQSCRECGGEFLQLVGQGTEQLEEALGRLLAGASVARLDRDVARRKGAVARILAEFEAGRTQVLVGTQMIAKGHDFPGVTLVGVLQADRALWLPDFRAAERVFQLLTQVAGRAGRRREPGLVVVQSYSPEHPALALASRQQYPPFYESEAASREALRYPPFTHLVSVLVSGEEEAAARELCERLGRRVREGVRELGQVLGPAPAPLARLRDRFRFQLLVKGSRRRPLHAALREALAGVPVPEELAVEVDVDPQSLL